MKRKSGARYRLNRWREQQLWNGVRITYKDLIEEYVRLNQTSEPFAKVPHGRYINFVAAYHAANPEATRREVTAAWRKLKRLDIPKTYRAWSKWRKT